MQQSKKSQTSISFVESIEIDVQSNNAMEYSDICYPNSIIKACLLLPTTVQCKTRQDGKENVNYNHDNVICNAITLQVNGNKNNYTQFSNRFSVQVKPIYSFNYDMHEAILKIQFVKQVSVSRIVGEVGCRLVDINVVLNTLAAKRRRLGKSGFVKLNVNVSKTDLMVIKQIIAWNTHQDVVYSNMDVLFLTHKEYFPSVMLLRELCERYFVEPPTSITGENGIKEWEHSVRDRIRIKVIKSICDWMKNYWTLDFKDNIDGICDELEKWMDELPSDTGARLVRKQYRMLEKNGQRNLFGDDKIDWSSVIVDKKIDLMQIGIENLAEQITLMDMRLFRRIGPRELVGKQWKKKHVSKLAPNVLAVIRLFNDITTWFQMAILNSKNLKQRVKMVEKVIKIGAKLHQLNNFHSLCAVFFCLNSAPIHRLKDMWRKVDEDQKREFEQFRKLFHSGLDHRNIRAAMRQSTGDCIPHLSIFLQDLVFKEDGNHDRLANANLDSTIKMINFTKYVRIARVIEHFKSFGMIQYSNIKQNLGIQKALMNDFDRFKTVSEDDLWNISTAVKESDRQSR